MANFSRHTFDPAKNYIAVRLQQGVPLLDADWNELNDVTRHELYDGLHLTFSDGIQPGGFDFEVLQTSPATNDFQVLAGSALVLGRPVHMKQNLRYSAQPWTDSARAARDGVAVIPPLTTPAGDRTDIVYLDVWERQVASDEDDQLVNPAIGIETSVRLKREAAVRVAEGTAALPPAAAGHVFLPLALLHHLAGEPIKAEQIEDARPFFHSPQGSRVASFFPAFLPVGTSTTAQMPAWRLSFSFEVGQGPVPKFHAFKTNTAAAAGVLPMNLSERARLTALSVRGMVNGPAGSGVLIQLVRIRHPFARLGTANEMHDILRETTIQFPSGGLHAFNRTFGFSTADPKLVVDNSRYYYALFAQASDEPRYFASVHGISIRYEHFGLVRPSHDHD